MVSHVRPGCAEALAEAEDALEEAIAGCINHGDPIPMPSAPLPGEHMVALPIDMAAKAAVALAEEMGFGKTGETCHQ